MGFRDEGGVPSAMLPEFQTEAPPPAPEAPEPVSGSSEVAAGGSRKGIGTGLEIPGPKGAAKAPATLHATITPGTPPDVAYGIAAREKRIADAQTLRHLTDMRASGATEQQMQAWARINDQDAETAQQIASDHFPRARQKIQQLQKDIDDARALKVDPFNWHKQIGRGGRAAAAFAALTGGFAAGKGSPNSAVKMMEAAIERDISAQEQNIKNQFDALKLQKGALQDERQLFDEQLNSINKIRAIKYAGVVGRIQAAKQHAVTEAHHLALQTAQDHFELKLLHSIAAANKEVLRLEVEAPIRNASQIVAWKQQIAQMQQQIAAGPRGGVTVPTEAVSTLEGDIVGQRPEAAVRMAPAPARAAAVGARRAPTGRGVATGGPSVAPDRRDGAAEMREPTIPEGAVAQDAEGRYLDSEGKVVEAREPKAPEAAPKRRAKDATGATTPSKGDTQRADAIARSIQIKPHVRQQQSFARLVAVDKNESTSRITRWDEAIADIAEGRAIRDGGMTGIKDAEVIREHLKAFKPDPSNYKGGENSSSYRAAMDQWQHAQDFPETLERDSFLSGEFAKVRTASGRSYSVMVGSRDKDSYKRIREEVTKMDRSLHGLTEMARIIRKRGMSGLWDKDTGFQISGLTDADPTTMEAMNMAITQAMNYIKTHDPTARISDKDLEVGMQAAVPWQGKMAALTDFVQRMVGADPKQSKRAEAFLARLAIETQRTFYANMANDLVPDYNTMEAIKDEGERVDRFISTGRGPKD